MDVQRAKAVAEIADVVIKTAKLEIDYAEAFGVTPGSGFVALESDATPRLNHQRVQ